MQAAETVTPLGNNVIFCGDNLNATQHFPLLTTVKNRLGIVETYASVLVRAVSNPGSALRYTFQSFTLECSRGRSKPLLNDYSWRLVELQHHQLCERAHANWNND